MKLLILFILFSFILGCKNYKSSSPINEENPSDSFIDCDIIKELIDLDAQLNCKRAVMSDFLLADTTCYADTFAQYLNSVITNGKIKDSEFRDTMAYFVNCKPGDNTWRILVYDGFQRDPAMERYAIEKILKGYNQRYFRFHYLDYFKYKNVYYVKYYNVYNKTGSMLTQILIIQNNKLLYFNYMPTLRIEKNFQTPEEYFEDRLNTFYEL